jgi:hypothetical protein
MIKMENDDKINQYDLVEIIQVPEKLKGVINIGDIGVVVAKYDDENVQIECVRPGGFYKWLEILNIRHVRLKSKDPFNSWIKKSLMDTSMTQKSIALGAVIGTIFGSLIGAGFGAITTTLDGFLIGLVIGLVLGIITGVLTAALTVRTAGTTGGVSVGAYTGMAFGAVLGLVIGVLVPTSLRMSANTQGMPVLDALTMGRFETAILTSFLLSILGTMVGAWIGGKNLVPRNLKNQ